jgi:hypothetical protein
MGANKPTIRLQSKKPTATEYIREMDFKMVEPFRRIVSMKGSFAPPQERPRKNMVMALGLQGKKKASASAGQVRPER